MKCLFIHPKDITTDFLKPIYKGLRNKTVISENFSDIEQELQKDYDTVVLLGHGWMGGLVDKRESRTIFGGEYAENIRNKNVISIFCNAYDYMHIYKIDGFATGMFISEPAEAVAYDVVATKEQINSSNALFAEVIKNAIRKHIKDIYHYVKKYYVEEGNPVVKINRQFMNIDPWED